MKGNQKRRVEDLDDMLDQHLAYIDHLAETYLDDALDAVDQLLDDVDKNMEP